jgi:hypothetical protein
VVAAVFKTYSRRTENANTTIAFSLNFMRNDQTSKSEMPKMKTSSATAVSSTPFHRRHCSWSASVTRGLQKNDLPYQCNVDYPIHSKASANCTGKQLPADKSSLPLHSWRVPQMRPLDVSEWMSSGCTINSWKLLRRMLRIDRVVWQRSQSVQ